MTDQQMTSENLPVEQPSAENGQLFAGSPFTADEPYTPFATKQGMWGKTSADTSGFNGLQRKVEFSQRATQPFGGWFDQVANRLTELVPGFSTGEAHLFRDELTMFVKQEKLLDTVKALRDDEQLRFEVCYSVSGVHYPDDAGREFHVVYHLMSYTHNRRLRLEVTAPSENPVVPSVCRVYPMANYHERETYDMFGIIFEAHPSLTRILMPDDWQGFPQRKDYPLGGIPVQYKGASVPPVDLRRSY